MRILLLRLRLIGDVTFTTPLVRALRRQYPDAHLSYLVEPAAEPVVRGNPHLSEVIVAPKRRGLARLRDDLALARRLRRARFDVAVDLHGGPRSAWFAWASGAPRRIGYTIAGRSWMYTDVVPRADLAPRHSVLKQWDLLRPLGIDAATPEHDPVEMADDPAATAAIDRRLREAGLEEAPVVAVHASANNPFRRWPEASFVDLVCALVQRDPRRAVVVFSGPSDLEAAARITAAARARLGDLGRAVPDAGAFTVAEIRALARRAAVYIGGDSGPLHIAATTATPIVALLGPTLAARSMPWRDPRWFAEAVEIDGLPCRPCAQRTCAPGDFRCLTRVTPERVAAAVERAIHA